MSKRRATESFNLSFLDIMSCGFGAIILLLMITKSTPPEALESNADLTEGTVLSLQQQLFEIRGETTILNRELNARHEQLDDIEEKVARLRRERQNLEDNLSMRDLDTSSDVDEMGQLRLAQQTLTEEMQRLQAEQDRIDLTEAIGGIPVDSEYIIFIIDTSGSMFNYAWNRMLEVVVSTLDIYPQVEGIQVMNDMGDFLFSSYNRDWMPDSPARRLAITQRLRSWTPFSNSSPVEGITTAIRTFYDPRQKISIYVLGDEFTGRSIANVVEQVNILNRVGEGGERLVRIHGIGFPVYFDEPLSNQVTNIRFATLMRELARRNGGTFVGLRDYY